MMSVCYFHLKTKEIGIPIKKGDIMIQIDGTSSFIVTGEMHKDISPMYICGINTLGKLQISFNE